MMARTCPWEYEGRQTQRCLQITGSPTEQHGNSQSKGQMHHRSGQNHKKMGRTWQRVLGGGNKLVLPFQNTAAGLMVSSVPQGGAHIHGAQQE
jgi:hypothetical protein